MIVSKRFIFVLLEFNRKNFTIKPVAWENSLEEIQAIAGRYEQHDELLGSGDNLFYSISKFQKTEVT